MKGRINVYEYTNEIKRIEGCINEIKQRISTCPNEKEKNQLINYKKRVCGLCIDVVRFYLEEHNDRTNHWDSSISRRKIFEELHVYFGKDYLGNDKIAESVIVKDWVKILEFYQRFLDYEIIEMDELRTITIFDLIEKKKPKSVLKSEEIKKLFDYLEEAQAFNYGIEGFKEEFIYLKNKITELKAHLLYEKGHYLLALELYRGLAEEHNKADSIWHSKTFTRIGDIRCAMGRYDLALEEYDLAALVIDGSLYKPQIEEVKERRSQIAAILGQ